jgi:hypothetical protein
MRAGRWWFTLVILATPEAEIKRVTVASRATKVRPYQEQRTGQRNKFESNSKVLLEGKVYTAQKNEW